MLNLLWSLIAAAACRNSAFALVIIAKKDALSYHLLDLLAAELRCFVLLFPSGQQVAPFEIISILRLLAVANTACTNGGTSACEPGACALPGHRQPLLQLQ